MQLSAQQEPIVDWFRQPAGKRVLVVIARAGCAKTTTAVAGLKAAPERAKVALAFNTRIAKELQARLGKDARTFHSLGMSYVLAAWPGTKVDNKRGLRLAQAVCDNAPQAIVTLVRRLASYGKLCAPLAQSGADLVALAEQFDCLPDDQWSKDWPLAWIADRAYQAMELAAQRDGTIDFDDMLYVPLRARLAVPKYDLIVVDEAQDCNRARLLLAKAALRKGGRAAFVGDDRQAIYGWQGADTEVLHRVSATPSAVTLPLTRTWRCGSAIVDLARTLVPDYEAATDRTGQVISTNLEKALDTAQNGSTAFLSRKNAPLIGVCLALLRRGKRARVEGRDIGEQLAGTVRKVAGSKRDLVDFFGALDDWHGKEAAKLKSDDESKRQRLDDLVDTLNALSEDLVTVAELLARIDSLFSDTDQADKTAIVCSSVHKAKGLEWSTVFVLTDTLYACKPDAGKDRQLEESNLAYVAYTRAIDELYLTSGLPG